MKSSAAIGPGHVGHDQRHRRRRRLAEAVQEQQRSRPPSPVRSPAGGGAARGRSCRADDRSRSSRATLPRNSSTIELTRSGCSMWTKWPASSSTSQRPYIGMYGTTFSTGVPQPSPRLRRRGCRGTASAGPAGASASTPGATVRSRRSAWRGRSSSATRRRTRTRRRSPAGAATRCGSRGFIRPRRSRQFVDRSRAGARDVAVRRRWSSQPAISSAIIFDRSCSAMSGIRRVYGMPSMLTRWVNRNDWASASCVISAPPFECADDGQRPTRATRGRRPPSASRMSASHEYSSAWALSPWPRCVPADDPPSAGGQLRREHVVRAGEVHAAVHEQQRRGVLVTPFVDRDADTVRVQRVLRGPGRSAPG